MRCLDLSELARPVRVFCDFGELMLLCWTTLVAVDPPGSSMGTTPHWFGALHLDQPSERCNRL